ncbi:sulfite exporter TauE/SafE family protein [Tepidiphilus baoligensis]|uniref:Probable membrane transporter protein n=1 Tax=Tepidiphilus baoligensis TaxID=2698687 RepID=A0ABX1QQ56_9PROT|nr:sulfite exporter TauE/SafE family protein [Tepidiphilus baoligensis]NMH17143.1 TSUP family transporter [Tepidiphilus baoligensis]
MDAWWLAYPLLGVVVGLFAGLLGVGGGAIMVPILTSLYTVQGFPAENVVHLALGTSMASIVLTSVSSSRAHHARGAVEWGVVVAMGPGVLVGIFLASFIAAALPSRPLAIFFACFIAYVCVQMLLDIKPKPSRQLPGPWGLATAGAVIGAVSALVAIGGGSLTVPFLTWCNVPAHRAIGTSAALGLPIALAGTVGYLVMGWGHPGLPSYSLGYVYLPAVIGVSAVSYFTAPLGATLAHRLPVRTLKRIFALVLLALLAKMLHALFG